MPLHAADGVIALIDVVSVEEAEPFATWLREHADGTVEIGGCTHLHTAALQALLAVQPSVTGAPADEFLCRWVLPLLTHYRHTNRPEDTP